MILQVAKRIANIRFDLIMPIRENSLVHVLKWQGFRGMVRESFTGKRKTASRKNMNQGGFFMEKNRNEHRTFTTDRLLLRPWTEQQTVRCKCTMFIPVFFHKKSSLVHVFS